MCQTRHIPDAAELGRVKRGAQLIDSACGLLVDKAALAESLREDRIVSAATVVLAGEPPLDR